MEQPVYYWDPVVAPSGMIIYWGLYPGSGAGTSSSEGFSSQALVLLVVEGDRVVGEERLLPELNARIREVVQGPEGAVYLLTDAGDGKLLKIAPR